VSTLTDELDAERTNARSRYRMGKLTVAQEESGGWVVLEDGRRVGGTLRYPFPGRKYAQRWVEQSLKEEAELNARGEFDTMARAKIIRETDPELWARYEEAELEIPADLDPDEYSNAAIAVHRAATL
jgi:hypothetical protein